MSKIPKVIHQIWIGDLPMPVKVMQTWKDKHPDFDFMLWDNEAMLGRQWKCSKQLNQMLEARRYNGAADIMRYEILYEFGGFVAPADSVCLNPIDDLLDNEIFCCYENETARPNLLSPHLGTAPENKLIRLLLEGIASSDDVLYDDPWKVTGNALLTGAVKLLKYPITILPSHTFIPNHYTGLRYAGKGKVYADHLWGTTKNISNNLDEQI